jgi:thiamine transport system substrate-binding protein
MRKIVAIFIVVSFVAGSALASCSAITSSFQENPQAITLISYDAFTPAEGIFDDFTAENGVAVNVITAGDTGSMVSKAILTSGNPEGDVMFGIDNTFLSRAQAGNVLLDYTPVDESDVCVNYDKEWFSSRGITPPQSFEDLALPAYKGLLSAPDPVNSAPGFAFLLASIEHFGEGKWQNYWKQLRANDVRIANDWTAAYTIDFSGSSGNGKYPIVVSYGSSPAAEVLFSETPLTTAPTGVVSATCFQATEYVGVLRGSKNEDLARKLVDYLLARKFQGSMPTSLFVYPVNKDAVLPEVFLTHAVRPTTSNTPSAESIEKNRDQWIDAWRNIFS